MYISDGPPQRGLGVGLEEGGIGELLGMGVVDVWGSALIVGVVGEIEEVVYVGKTAMVFGVYVGKLKLGPRGAVHFSCKLGKIATPAMIIMITPMARMERKIVRLLICCSIAG
jgi:hypothetical protein